MTWVNRRALWVARHWLALANTFFLTYVGLPFLAPVLLAYGFTGPANTIYSLYRAACHQFPSRAYFIFGEQVALCHRDIAIYATLLAGGLVFGFIRHRLKPPPFHWYAFMLVPIALDGGMQMVSELLQVAPVIILWAIGLILIGVVMVVAYSQQKLTWHVMLFLAFGPLALLYVQFFGPYHSDLLRRNLTGFIFGLGTVWFAYPYLEESFRDIYESTMAGLTPRDL
jgi:uncharacterized membrane protein